MALNIEGLASLASGTVTVLSSSDPLDENTFGNPQKVVPRTAPIAAGRRSIAHTFPPYSLSVFRLKVR